MKLNKAQGVSYGTTPMLVSNIEYYYYKIRLECDKLDFDTRSCFFEFTYSIWNTLCFICFYCNMFYVNTLQKFMQDYVFSPRGKNNTQHMKKHRPDSSFLDT